MLLKEVLRGLQYEILQGSNVDIGGISIDSRRLRTDTLFVCLVGTKVNGHSYINDAAREGVAAILISEAQPSYPPNTAIIRVANTRHALAIAAANLARHPSDSFDLIGVTGTKGKTSTTYFMDAVLSEIGHKVGVIGTIGFRIGNRKLDLHSETATTPDPVELQQLFSDMKDERVNDVVMEVSSHALALHKVDGLKFHVGIFTNLAHEHLEFHKTMEDYRDAKARLFELCRYGVINADDPAAAFMQAHAQQTNPHCICMTYGIDRPANLNAKNIRYLDNGVAFDLELKNLTSDSENLPHANMPHVPLGFKDGLVNDKNDPFFVSIKGRFTVYNILSVISAAMVMNIPLSAVKSAIAKLETVPGRIQDVPNPYGFHVIVDYAHTPNSLVNIINAVRMFTKGKLITLFGCGGDKDTGKRPMMGKIAGELSDYCILTSDNPRTEDPEAILDMIEQGVLETSCPYERLADRQEAINRGISLLSPEDALIIAGKGHENYQILADRTIHFDDVEIAQSAIKSIGRSAH